MSKVLILGLTGVAVVGAAAFLAVPEQASAQGLVPCGYDMNGNGIVDTSEQCNVCHLFQLGGNIVNFLLVPSAVNSGFAIVPVLAALLFAWGGFVWVTAFGSPGRVQEGKKIIFATIIGILIVYGAWLFINLLLNALNVNTFTGTNNWWQIDCAF
jgi:hypothetical protein